MKFPWEKDKPPAYSGPSWAELMNRGSELINEPYLSKPRPTVPFEDWKARYDKWLADLEVFNVSATFINNPCLHVSHVDESWFADIHNNYYKCAMHNLAQYLDNLRSMYAP